VHEEPLEVCILRERSAEVSLDGLAVLVKLSLACGYAVPSRDGVTVARAAALRLVVFGLGAGGAERAGRTVIRGGARSHAEHCLSRASSPPTALRARPAIP